MTRQRGYHDGSSFAHCRPSDKVLLERDTQALARAESSRQARSRGTLRARARLQPDASSHPIAHGSAKRHAFPDLIHGWNSHADWGSAVGEGTSGP